MINIVLFDEDASYDEMGQDDDLTFSFLHQDGDTFYQAHAPIKCRDFYNEALVGCQINSQPDQVFGFEYPVNEYPIQFDKLRQLLNGADLDALIEKVPLLNEFEAYLGWEYTTVTKVFSNSAYLEADKRWLRAAPILSYYTHMVRCLYSGSTEGHTWFPNFLESCADQSLGNASRYQSVLNKVPLTKLLVNLDKIFPEGTLPKVGMSDWSENDEYDFHDEGGIVSFCQAVLDDIDGEYYTQSEEAAREVLGIG